MQLTIVAPFGIKGFPAEQVLPFIRSWGGELVHVVRDFEVKWPAGEILSLLTDNGLRAESYHADQGEHIDLTAENLQSRKQAIDRLSAEAEFALELGVSIIIVHSSGAKGTDGVDRSSNFRWSAQLLAEVAETLDVTFLVENMPPDHAYGVEVGRLVRDIRSIGSPRLGFCFDTGHANMGRLPVAQQIADSNGYIHYIHAHDNDGKEDMHLLPFTGTIDWSAVGTALKNVNYDRTFCLEVFETVDKLARKLTTQWWDKLVAFLDGRYQ